MSHDHGHHTKADYEHELVEHDQWFRHSPDEPHHQQGHGSAKPMPIIVVMVGTVVLVFGLSWLVKNYFHEVQADMKIDRREAITDTSPDLGGAWHATKADWDAELANYAWLPNADRKELVRLPFEAAMKKVVADYHDAPRGKYSLPPSAPVAAPAAGTSTSVPASPPPR